MATGDPIVAVGTSITLEAAGAAITNGAVVPADDAEYALAADAANWPDAEFALAATWATSTSIEGRVVNLYARPLDIDGTADAEIPEAARPTMFIGSFVANGVTTLQYMQLQGGFARDLPRKAAYYLHNDTGQTISSGWTLKATPRNVIPSP